MNQTQEPSAEGPTYGTGDTPAPPTDPSAPTGGDTPGGPQGEPRNGPRVTRDQVFDVERLRRSSADKYLGGVAGGLGRHLDIDPLVVRVIFVVTSFFGVGILLYGALWLLLPDDFDQAPLETSPDTRKVLVLVAGGLAAVMLVGAVLGDGWGVFPLAAIGLVALAVYAAVRPRGPRAEVTSAPAGTPAVPPGAYGPAPTTGAPHGPTEATAWTYPPPPRRPRRTGPVLFWPTLAVLAIALGSLAIYDLDHAVAAGAYAALSLAVIGLALAIGAFVGRAGGLILLGLLALPPLLITSTVGNDVTRSSGDQTERPTLASQVQESYDVNAGRLELDLTGLDASELARLDGRAIEIDMVAGEIIVRLPPEVDYDVDAELSMAGEVRVGDRVVNGPNPAITDRVDSGSADQPTLSLDVEGVVGRVQITQEGDVR